MTPEQETPSDATGPWTQAQIDSWRTPRDWGEFIPAAAFTAFIVRFLATVDHDRAALEAVRKLHRPIDGWCPACAGHRRCPTFRLADEALIDIDGTSPRVMSIVEPETHEGGTVKIPEGSCNGVAVTIQAPIDSLRNELAWLIENSDGIVGLKIDGSVMSWSEVIARYVPDYVTSNTKEA